MKVPGAVVVKLPETLISPAEVKVPPLMTRPPLFISIDPPVVKVPSLIVIDVAIITELVGAVRVPEF